MEDLAPVEIVVVAETKESKMSTTPAPSDNIMNIAAEEADYYRKRIIWNFKATCLWSAGYFVIFCVVTTLIMHKHWLHMIEIVIPVSLVYFLTLWRIIYEGWGCAKSYLMNIGTRRTNNTASKEEVSNYFVALFMCSTPYIILYFLIMFVTTLLAEERAKEFKHEDLKYLGYCFLVVVTVKRIHFYFNLCKVEDDFVEFDKRVLLQSTTHEAGRTQQQQQQQIKEHSTNHA